MAPWPTGALLHSDRGCQGTAAPLQTCLGMARSCLRLGCLPPDCPHLNRLETLGRWVKPSWLSPTAYTIFARLRKNSIALLNAAGLKHGVSFS